MQLGRGRDYSWSATSAGQDIIDTYAVKLCEPGGGTPTINSDHYLFRGQCLPFDVLTRTNSWVPTPADDTPAGSHTLTTLRTKLGVVIARAMINGEPHAYTKLRFTYFHEVDPSALGFADFNNPNKMRTPQDFMQAANRISYTFNWFYVDDENIAYFNSGANPVRPSDVDPNLPTFGRDPFLWQGFNPNTATADIAPLAAAPARRQPELPDELEQPPGAGLQHRLLVALPIAAARRSRIRAPHRRRQEDHASSS